MTRVLIIGAGGIAFRHVEHLQAIDGVRIVGVCDIDRARAEKWAGKTGAPAFTDAQAAIAAARPDYAVILTPRRVREPLIDLCLAYALPFLVEKPPCDVLPTGRRIQAKIAAAGLLHSVGFMHRWNEAMGAAMAELRDEPISLITIRHTAPFAAAPDFSAYPDPYLVEHSGGLVGDQGIHYIDLARYLTRSEVEDIQATGINLRLARSEHVTSVDTACWTLRMRNGVLVNHSHTWNGPDWDCQLDVVTPKSRACVSLFGNTASGRIRGQDWTFIGTRHECRSQHEGFLQALANRDQSLVRSPYADALESFAVAARVNRLLYGHSGELGEEMTRTSPTGSGGRPRIGQQ